MNKYQLPTDKLSVLDSTFLEFARTCSATVEAPMHSGFPARKNELPARIIYWPDGKIQKMISIIPVADSSSNAPEAWDFEVSAWIDEKGVTDRSVATFERRKSLSTGYLKANIDQLLIQAKARLTVTEEDIKAKFKASGFRGS